MNKNILVLTLLLTSVASYGKSSNTELNRSIVVSFYNEVLIQRNAKAIDNYIDNDYVQHNPDVPNGKQALKNFISNVPSKTPGEIVRVIADGNLVVLHVKRYKLGGEKNRVIVDIFRVENGKIVEHWDVIQAIPNYSQNGNSMY